MNLSSTTMNEFKPRKISFAIPIYVFKEQFIVEHVLMVTIPLSSMHVIIRISAAGQLTCCGSMEGAMEQSLLMKYKHAKIETQATSYLYRECSICCF